MPLDTTHMHLLVGQQMLLHTLMWLIAWIMLGEERRAIAHWFGFTLLLSLGQGLASLNPASVTPWLVEVLPGFLVVAGFVLMRRGAELFLRQPPRDLEHGIVAAASLLLSVVIGAGADMRPERILLMSACLAWVVLRGSWAMREPLRTQFGRRPALSVVLPLLLFGVLNLYRVGSTLIGRSAVLAGTASGLDLLVQIAGLIVTALFSYLFLFLLVMRLRGRLNYLAERDPLTGLLNRRAMLVALEREWHRHQRLHENFALVSADLDHFKLVNDRHGHSSGDAVLKEAAFVFKAQARNIDVVARMGGEEFLLLLPGCDVERALIVAQRLRQRLYATPLKLPGGGTLPVTASFGVASAIAGDADIDTVLRRVEAALFLAKGSGRNRVMTQDDVARGVAWAETAVAHL
ncbi:MAG: hypothetical protein RJA44_2174 [Pseudomonadota bacterium]